MSKEKLVGEQMWVYPIPWVPWGRIENSQAPGLLAAPPRFHRAPAAPAAAHRQGSSRPFGPRAAKCVTTHFCRGLSSPPLPPPGPLPCFRSAVGPPGGSSAPLPCGCFSPRASKKLAFLAVLTRFQGPAPWRPPRPRARLARFPNKSSEFKEKAPNLAKS